MGGQGAAIRGFPIPLGRQSAIMPDHDPFKAAGPRAPIVPDQPDADSAPALPSPPGAVDRLRGRGNRLADGILPLLVSGAAFALACQDLYDADIWWHLRAGQWMWARGRVPAFDPFSFASIDRPWIDLHWLFQVILAAVFRADGVRGMILMAAGLYAVTLWVAVSARDDRWPSWVVVACWLPALLVMSARFVPRPEAVSLLGVAVYLAVLLRTDKCPALAWVLPVFQVFWVNAHGLFVLGPIILASNLADRLVTAIRRPAPGGHPPGRPPGMARWWHIGGAAAAVGVACLVNPYGLRGALFPLELFPKITAWGGPYKSSITEFFDLRAFVEREGVAVARTNLYFRAQFFLLGMLPVSFIMPAAWRAGRLVSQPGTAQPRRAWPPMAWLGVFALAASLLLASVPGLPAPGTAEGMIRLGQTAPAGLLVLGSLGAATLVIASHRGALLAALGGAALAAWTFWLRAHLLGAEFDSAGWLMGPGSPALGRATTFLGGVVTILVLRAGGRVFRLLLAAGFSYLAIQAIRNVNLFGLVAGFVIAANLGEWAAELAAELPAGRLWNWAGLGARVALAGVAGLWIVAIVKGPFYRVSGEPRMFSLKEDPLAYAHEATRFAGRPGLPDRALVFGLRPAGLYVYHNAPERKVFMDGRLEIPDRSTFETYVELLGLLNDGRPGWAESVGRMGDPLILLDHEDNLGAEATLLTDPDWRCLYYDAIASIFVSRRRRELDASFPSVDFAARHFGVRDPSWRSVPPVPHGLAEAHGLLGLEAAIRNRPGSTRLLRLSLVLAACDQFRQAIAVDPTIAGNWTALADGYRQMAPDRAVVALSRPDEPWDPAQGLLPAQATFCDRRARALDPALMKQAVSRSGALQGPRMHGVHHSLFAWRQPSPGAAGAVDVSRLRPRIGARDDALPAWEGREGLTRALDGLLQEGRAEAAVKLFTAALDRGIVPAWPACDRVATALVDLGWPAEAGKIWERAVDAPSPAVRSARMAAAALAAQDFPAAVAAYQAGLQRDPCLGEAWFGLALLHTELGELAPALAAARSGLRQPLTPAQASFLRGIETLIAPLAPGAGPADSRPGGPGGSQGLGRRFPTAPQLFKQLFDLLDEALDEHPLRSLRARLRQKRAGFVDGAEGHVLLSQSHLHQG
jgi:hypothetical protein